MTDFPCKVAPHVAARAIQLGTRDKGTVRIEFGDFADLEEYTVAAFSTITCTGGWDYGDLIDVDESTLIRLTDAEDRLVRDWLETTSYRAIAVTEQGIYLRV